MPPLRQTGPPPEWPLKPLANSFGVAWESPWREFRTSLRAFLTGPRPPKSELVSGGPYLRVEWVRGSLPGRALAASTLWHLAVVWILFLPIWGFLANAKPNLAPVRIEWTLYALAQDLPPISLPGAVAKPSPPGRAKKPLPRRGADAYHRRQTILSMPVRVTHPRQTLIQPSAPPTPPKIVPPLPNIVEWAAMAPPRPRLQIAPSAAAPRVRRRVVREVAAPEIQNLEKAAGPLNIAASPSVNPQPQMPVNPMSARIAERREEHSEAGPAPEIGPAPSEGDASLHRIIALSATPAPQAPEVSVPQGNLSARIVISPDGTQPGVPGGPERGPAANSGSGGDGGSMGGTNGGGGAGHGQGGGNLDSLPAAISISGGSSHSGNGGIAPAGNLGNQSSHKLILKPMPTIPSMADATASSRGESAVAANLDPSLPPEKILSGKEVYTLHINMPNLTSATGSWVLNFAQLDEGDAPPFTPKGVLSGPVPIQKVDPKYPPALIQEHVEGQVILYAIIRKDGSVDSIQLVRGPDPLLEQNAIEALAKWRFHPATRNGVPVELEAVVHIPFHFRVAPDY